MMLYNLNQLIHFIIIDLHPTFIYMLLYPQAVSANLTPAIRGQRPLVSGTPTITMQDLTAITGTTTAVSVASVAAARSAIQTTIASTSLANQTTQKLAAITGSESLPLTNSY